MIKYNVNGVTTLVTQWKFPDGCVGVNINNGVETSMDSPIIVTIVFGDDGMSINDDILALAQVRDALNINYPLCDVHLSMPYVPYARQDRACNIGDAHSMRAFAKLLNAMDFKTVRCLDPHSLVVDACINNMITVGQYDVFNGILTDWMSTYIISPDQGATKKCEEFAKRIGAKGVLTCTKSRDMKTGAITGLSLNGPVPSNTTLVVLDDIVDGGRTFVEVANAIRRYDDSNELILAVTHGLFTKGVDVVAMHYDKVYTTNSFNSNKEHDNVNVIKVI